MNDALGPTPRFGSKVSTAKPVRQVGFLFIGGEHQMLHLAPVAAALGTSTEGRCSARLFVGSDEDERGLRRTLEWLGADLSVERLPVPWWHWVATSVGVSASTLKILSIAAGRRMLRQLDAIVVAERTSTLLKRMPGACPPMIHIPHGVGDRARGFEKRIRLFDHVIVAGEKDRARMIAEGLLTPEICSVSGYVKLAAVLARDGLAKRRKLFDNDRKTVLYNPHFSSTLGSWSRFARVITAAVLDESDKNLLIVPHVRLVRRLTDSDRAWLERLASNPRVIVDLESPSTSDMTYTLGAEIYVGDVSSQVYEFLYRPRPCVFLNASNLSWMDDPSFAFWRFGEVVSEPGAVATALGRAEAQHSEYAFLQTVETRKAFGPYEKSPARAASMVEYIVMTGKDRTGHSP